MLNPSIRNEYVLEAFAVSKPTATGREGCIFGPRGCAVYMFIMVNGMFEFTGSELL